MPLPPDVKRLFAELPQARAEREARQKQKVDQRKTAAELAEIERAAARERLRSEMAVTWDWVLSDAQELAKEMDDNGINRLQLLGPINSEGQPSEWVPDARVIILMFDGTLEMVRMDDFRELRYAHRSAEEFLETEPPGVSRAFIEAVRSGEVWRNVSRQVREVTADPVD